MSRATRGYTMVELMMALAILAIGVSGIISMHKVTVAANQHAKNLATASHIAQAWQEQLAADATRWNHPSAKDGTSDLATDTLWLQMIATEGQWRRPAYNETVDFGPAFDALGNVVPAGSEQDAHYCTHVRFSWLYPEATPTVGNGLIRAEVRVFWLRDGEGTIDGQGVCDPGTPVNDVGEAVPNYHFVYKTSAIRQNTAQ
jgi:prepilin-type N-terminal cleavage/methylation domain-containing protein